MSDTVMHTVAEIGDLHHVKQLVEGVGFNPEAAGFAGFTPLHYASLNGHEAVVKYLIEDRRCDPNCRDIDGWTPLHWACRKGHNAVSKILIEDRRCDLNSRDRYGDTPLHEACRLNRVDAASYLLQEVKCNPNSTNKSGEVPLSITNSKKIIKALIASGADPKTLYSRNLASGCPALPGQAAEKVFMIGHPGAGKTTLTKALSSESSGVLSRLVNHLSKVSGVEQHTAGIIPHVLESKQLGLVNIFDFASHEEFHASHDAVVQNVMSGSAGVFLILADLQKSENEFLQSVSYWLCFTKNRAASLDTKPHALIVGTHSDLVSTQEKARKEKAMTSLIGRPVFSTLNVIGYIEIDSCYSESSSMTKLRESLSRSYESLGTKFNVAMDYGYHCFFIFLLQITEAPAVQLSSIISALNDKKDHELFGLLSSSPTELDGMCQALHNNGRIFYLRCSETIHQGWIILDQHSLLTKVNGTIFAPDGFKEHQALSSSTGVVPLSKLTPHFPDLNSDMMTQFLVHFEFCHKILDSETFQLLSPTSTVTGASSEQFLFFPALVSASKPDGVWEAGDEFSYHTGWLLQCSQPEDFFSPRFLQVLLLRLAFSFALSPTTINPEVSQHPALHRECKVWKNGIHWLQRTGVEGLVEITSEQVTVLVRSFRNHEMAAVQLRSGIIRVVLDAQKQFCASITPSEYLLHPSDATQYPLKPFHDLEVFGIPEVSHALADRKAEFVISVNKHLLEVDKLLYFEPYAHLGEDILRDIFDVSVSKPIGALLANIAEQALNKKENFIVVFETSRLLLQDRFSSLSFQTPIVEMKCVFEIWADQGEATRENFRQHLDKYSIFAGRNPLVT